MYRQRLRDSLPGVRKRIEAAALGAGRDPSTIRIVAVTKGHEVAAAEAALEAGLIDLGENRIEELERKAVALASRGARWHLIGHLQGRKVGMVGAEVHLLHSLDSMRLAERLGKVAMERDEPLRVLVQVNVSGEESKGGFSPNALVAGIETILSLGSLKVEGLMTMAPLTDDVNAVRDAFRGLRELQEEVRARVPTYQGRELSMGMSNDFEVAVAEGSTILRLGTVLFGERPE